MTTWITFFRGINVGGNNKLPMKALQQLLEQQGYTDVRTYIQSGNVVLSSSHSSAAKLGEDLGTLIKEHFGFHPQVMVLTASELEKAISLNPFRTQADENPKSVHVLFLEAPPQKPNLDALNDIKTESESFALKDQFFYLYTPDGMGRSKLAERVEKLLGVKATARNWNTTTKMLALAQA